MRSAVTWANPKTLNLQARVLREWTWELELKGELTRQRRMEALDKLMSVMTLLVGAVMSCQAVGLDGALFTAAPDLTLT